MCLLDFSFYQVTKKMKLYNKISIYLQHFEAFFSNKKKAFNDSQLVPVEISSELRKFIFRSRS